MEIEEPPPNNLILIPYLKVIKKDVIGNFIYS